MALMFTPGQFARRAEFYFQIAQMTHAGLGIIGALEQLQRNPPHRSFREPITKALAQLSQGRTFAEALQSAGGWLPDFDISLIRAGEESGRLDACFRLLSKYYSNRAQIARQIIGDMAYPAFLLHFAVFIIPFPQLFLTGNIFAYLQQTLRILLPIYAVIIAVVYLSQNRHAEGWRAIFERIVNAIPVLGTARRHLALSRLAMSLESLLSAGVTITEAWEMAAEACGSPALKRRIRSWRPLVEAGRTHSEALSNSPEFPHIFVTQYTTGELSGTLDDTLRRLSEYYQEDGTRKMHAVVQWTPRAVYLIIVLVIAYRIIQFWTGYFRQVQEIGNF